MHGTLTGRPRGVASGQGHGTAYGRPPRHHNGGCTREVRPALSTRAPPPVQPLPSSPGMSGALGPPSTRPPRNGTSRGGGPSSSSPCSDASAGAADDDGHWYGGAPPDSGGGHTARHPTPVAAVGPRGGAALSTRPGAAWPTRGGAYPYDPTARARHTDWGALSAARLALPGRHPWARRSSEALAPCRRAVWPPWWPRKSRRGAAATGTPGRGPTPGWSAAPRRVPRPVCSEPRRERNRAGPTRLATTSGIPIFLAWTWPSTGGECRIPVPFGGVLRQDTPAAPKVSDQGEVGRKLRLVPPCGGRGATSELMWTRAKRSLQPLSRNAAPWGGGVA